MQELYKQALMHREALENKTKEQDWGIASAIDDIRTKVVEEPYWLRPEGRAVTDDIQPPTTQSFDQSQPTAEPTQTPEHSINEQDKEPVSMQSLYQSHLPEQDTPEQEHVYGKDGEEQELDSNCDLCGQSMDSEICNPDPERIRKLEEERGMDI